LKVHNKSDEPIKLTWDGRSVTVQPGKVGMATFEQVVNHFGHPAAGTVPTKMFDETGAMHVVPPRADERARISIKQNWELGQPHAGTGLMTLNRVPDVEIYDQDDQRIWTVAEDPLGEHQMTSTATPFNQTDQIARMERQLDLMKKQMSGGSADLRVPGVSQTDSELPDLDVPTDDS
jgi:hypothetical protein